VSGRGISWAICKSASRSRQITMPAPHHSVFYRPGVLPAAQQTASKHWRQTVAVTVNSWKSTSTKKKLLWIKMISCCRHKTVKFVTSSRYVGGVLWLLREACLPICPVARAWGARGQKQSNAPPRRGHPEFLGMGRRRWPKVKRLMPKQVGNQNSKSLLR